MSKGTVDRWPVIYNIEDLKKQIEVLKDSPTSDAFYQSSSDQQKILCQGDIIKLDKEFIYYDEDGEISALEVSSYWVIMGNTCDIQREYSTSKYTQVAPLLEQTEAEMSKKILKELKNYQSFKKFYYHQIDEKHYILDFAQSCTIDKSYLVSNVEKIKELTYAGWVLLHCCLVRYLARDDGRND